MRSQAQTKIKCGWQTEDAAAQKKRWAAFHASKTEAAKPEAKPVSKMAAPELKPKRKLSRAQKAALVANLKKARAARAAKRSAGEKVPF